MSNIVTDVFLADEIRAGQALWDAMRGKPVSASAAADAAVTIGSDALMFVPGLGAAVGAVKAGRIARTANKATKLARASNKLRAKDIESTRQAIGLESMGKKAAAERLRKQAAKAKAKRVALDQTVDKLRRKTGTKTIEQDQKLVRAMQAKKRNLKKKRNSPKRKKMRYTGNVASTTKDILDYGRYMEEE